MSTKNRTRRTTTRNIRFPNQMIEQIQYRSWSKKGPGISAWVIEACRSETNVRKESIYIN